MAYYNGTVANLSGLLTALTTACVTDGWTYAGGELVKHGCYFPITVDVYSGAYSRLAMQIKDPVTSAVSTISSIKEMSNVVISFPAEYHIFSFDKEVYCVLNIQPGVYAWIAFGSSTISVPGTGAFLSASCSGTTSTIDERNFPVFFGSGTSIVNALYQASSFDSGYPHLYPFKTTSNGYLLTAPALSSWYGGAYGVGASQPNAFSGESILTPMLAFVDRESSKVGLVLATEHARHVRIDNYEDEQIITYGSDKWMILPWKKRNSSARDTVSNYTNGDTGTFGWAIRYEGP